MSVLPDSSPITKRNAESESPVFWTKKLRSPRPTVLYSAIFDQQASISGQGRHGPKWIVDVLFDQSHRAISYLAAG